jgi:hypothetical protein
MTKLGDIKNPLVDVVLNEDGSYTFTNVASLQINTPAVFSLIYNGANYTGTYKGMAAVKLSVDGKLGKLAVTGFTSFQKNGRVILQLNNIADIFLTVSGNVVNAIFEGCVNSFLFLL